MRLRQITHQDKQTNKREKTNYCFCPFLWWDLALLQRDVGTVYLRGRSSNNNCSQRPKYQGQILLWKTHFYAFQLLFSDTQSITANPLDTVSNAARSSPLFTPSATWPRSSPERCATARCYNRRWHSLVSISKARPPSPPPLTPVSSHAFPHKGKSSLRASKANIHA